MMSGSRSLFDAAMSVVRLACALFISASMQLHRFQTLDKQGIFSTMQTYPKKHLMRISSSHSVRLWCLAPHLIKDASERFQRDVSG